jgi:hypothetical protein
MKRVRAICRAITGSPLLGMALGVCAVVALGSVLAPARPAHPEKAPAHWAAAPASPRPLFLEEGREAKLVGDSFDSHAPAVGSGLSAHPQPGVEKSWGKDERRRVTLPVFGPLFQRPPPRAS